jgi:TetR/AcrR family transcriptional repressor of nem operon
MSGVHQALAACLDNTEREPLQRMRDFFETVAESYRGEGYLGCLLGGLGQELSGVNEVFAQKIDACFTHIAERMSSCLEEARLAGDIAPTADTEQLAGLLVDCWEGAALRSRLRRSEAPLTAMLDFYFRSAITATH